MTKGEAIKVIENICYKPGFTFRIYMPPYIDGIELVIISMTHDAECWKEDLPPVIPITFCAIMFYEELKRIDKKLFIGWIRSQIHEFEKHERMEWFRYKGNRVDDPHPEVRIKMSDKAQSLVLHASRCQILYWRALYPDELALPDWDESWDDTDD